MRQLSDTLLTAQKQAGHIPYVKVEARNTIAGVVKLKWTRLYTGSEDDYFHAVTLSGDGSLIRARITPPADSRKLYHQRVANPGAGSDFSQWIYTNQYNAVVVACCSLGAEASIFWVKSDRQIYQLKSTDYGVNWGSPELLGYTPTIAIYGIAAAYKPNGDIALFFADQTTLYVKKRISGSWQSDAAWDKSTGDLSGVATVYDGDWNLLVTGKDANGNFKLWSLVYGDGGEVVADTWSELKPIASAPSDGDFEYNQVFLDKPDVYRCFFVEKFSGIQAYHRPFWSHSIPDTGFPSNQWLEPVPFDLSSEYGLAMAHYGDYCWLATSYGVWRAKLTPVSLELTDDVISSRQELTPGAGRLVIELRNDTGQYASPGQGALSVLDTGCQLDFSPGYVTTKTTEILRPDAVGDEENIHNATSGAGNHWQDVDEVTPDEDTSTVYDDTLDDNYYRDLYAISSPAVSGDIRGVTVYARCKTYLFTPTRASLKIAIKTNGAVYEGAEETLTTSYADYSHKWGTNPSTGLSWQQGEIENLQIGLALRNGRTPPTLATSIGTQVFAVIEYGGGNEVSSGQSSILLAYEHTSSGGEARLVLYASGAWNLLEKWVARHQFRWNKDTDEMCVKDILAYVLARAGLKLEVKSQSSVITSYYPDFAIYPNNRGKDVIARLLSFVPDVLFIEGNKACILNPLATDSSVYSYGGEHQITEGSYRKRAWELNRVQVEGYDTLLDKPVVVDSFAWDEIDRLYDRLSQLEDRNIDTVAKAQERGEAHLRQAEIESAGGIIRIPVNCGQQIYDVIDITDSRAGLTAEKKRVLGLTLVYNTQRGEYEQRLWLGAV